MPQSRPFNSSPLFRAFSRTGVLVLAATTLLSLGGCWAGGLSEGGDHISNDKFVYSSDPYSPKTIVLTDTRTKQPLWTGEIPVGQQMIVKFRPGRSSMQPTSMPDTMLWGLTRAGAYTAHNLNSIPCPPAGARRLEMTLRAAPEMSVGGSELVPAMPYGGDMPMPNNRSIGPGSTGNPTGSAPVIAPAAAPAAAPAPVATPAKAPETGPVAPKPANNDSKPPAVDLPETPAPAPASAPTPAPTAPPMVPPVTEPNK